MMPSYKLNTQHLKLVKDETSNSIGSNEANTTIRKATLLLDDYYKIIQYSGDIQQFLEIDYAPINQFILDIEPKFQKVNLSEVVKNVRLFGETITNIVKVAGRHYKFSVEPKKLGTNKMGILVHFSELNRTMNVKNAILEYSSDWHFCISREGLLKDYHSRRASFCGVSKPTIGASIYDTYNKKLSDTLMEGVYMALENGGFELEGQNISLDGMCFFSAKFYKLDSDSAFVKIHDITQHTIMRKTLERENKQYRTAFDNSPNGLAIVSPKGRFLHTNNLLNQWADSTTKRLKFHSLESFFLKFVENGENFIKKIQNFEVKIELDVTFVKNFGITTAKVSLKNVYDKLGGIQYIIFSINSTKAISQKVVEQQSIIDHTTKIEELERFAYAVSHDLREPLRTVKSFADLLNSKYSKEFNDEAKEYLQFILDGATNMNMLIEDLLTYSQIASEDDNLYEDINLQGLISTITQRNLFKQVKETNAQIILEPSVQRIRGVYIKLMQLFQNLISNSIKFRNPNSIPIVKIKMEETETHYKFQVSDNGIGMKEEYLNKIFQVFRKLHNKRQYKGSGIGLAICKKIVEQHKGNIYVTSIVGKGTTFHFTIKKNF